MSINNLVATMMIINLFKIKDRKIEIEEESEEDKNAKKDSLIITMITTIIVVIIIIAIIITIIKMININKLLQDNEEQEIIEIIINRRYNKIIVNLNLIETMKMRLLYIKEILIV